MNYYNLESPAHCEAKGGEIRKTSNKGMARYELIITDEDGKQSSVYAKNKSDLMRYKKQYGYDKGGRMEQC